MHTVVFDHGREILELLRSLCRPWVEPGGAVDLMIDIFEIIRSIHALIDFIQYLIVLAVVVVSSQWLIFLLDAPVTHDSELELVSGLEIITVNVKSHCLGHEMRQGWVRLSFHQHGLVINAIEMD